MDVTDPVDDLPLPYLEARRKDEPFWQRQEGETQGKGGQPCCTLSGISTGLMTLRGQHAVIVHGEEECASCFYHTGPSAPQFFCTGLSDEHFTLGQTRGPLERCLRLVGREVHPDAIFVLGACPIEVIGDRFEQVVADVQPEFPDIPMVPLHTHGLKTGSQAAMLDWMFSTLAGLPSTAVGAPSEEARQPRYKEAALAVVHAVVTRDRKSLDVARAHFRGERQDFSERSFNLLGLPQARWGERSELEELLGKVADFKVTWLPGHATLDDWRNAKEAQATFVFDPEMYPQLLAVLGQKGQTVHGVDLPIGVGATARTYRAIADRFGVAAELAPHLDAARAQADARVAAFRKKHQGQRMAMGLRMGNNYHADHVGKMGLGDYHFLSECGFDITLFIQGAPERAHHYKRFLNDNGLDRPFVMFAEPWTISQHLDGDRYDIAYLIDHCRPEARKAGVPFVAAREFDPGFVGVEANLRYLERALGGGGSA